MPRANRHYLRGYIWHITHRCHKVIKKEFRLQFARDRRAWMGWPFEAKKRYGLTVLNCTVTSNHIHFLVVDGKEAGTIPNSRQLMARQTGQQYKIRESNGREPFGKTAIMQRLWKAVSI